jgi:uncharacterized BrkB/YihY/UPF0761 family membrane protein
MANVADTGHPRHWQDKELEIEREPIKKKGKANAWLIGLLIVIALIVVSMLAIYADLPAPGDPGNTLSSALNYQ